MHIIRRINKNTAILKYVRAILVLAVVFLQLPAYRAYAFEGGLFDKMRESDQPVVVKGDRIEYFNAEKKVVGEGNVSVIYGDVSLKCDKITVFTEGKEAICEGNVKISQPSMSMEGDKIHYNFAKKEGYAIDGKIKAKPFYGGAGKIEQVGGKEFKLEKGYITTCDLEKPHYTVRAKEVQIFLDDKVVAKHTRFYIGKIPILYMPLYVQPIIEKWPEVTIIPGRTSDWGAFMLTAWRYYFNENSKGNIHLDYREKKGLAEGIDYTYKTKELGTGVARLYYAHENDAFTINKSGPKDDRWRMQYRHAISLPEDTSLMMEFNKLSDRDMIKDLLYREYEENPALDNYLLFETRKPNYTTKVLARKRMNEFFTVVERLPELSLEVNNQRLWDTSFYYFSDNSITNFIKRYDDETGISPEESVRMDNYHKLSYATKLFKFLYTTPFVATRQTYYSRNRWKDTSELRSIYETGVDLSTKFYRMFDVNSNFSGLNLSGLRHIITPTVGFLHRHQPTISPSNLHQFDEIDNIERHNGFNLALENKLQTKRPSGAGLRTVDLATLIVSTNYDFRLEKQSIEPQGVGKFGDLTFDLELRPYNWLTIDSDMILDHKTHDVNSFNIDVFIDMGKKMTLGVGHRYEHSEGGDTSQLTSEIFYKINKEWKIKAYGRYDFESEKLEEQEYTITKDLHCWEAALSLDIRDGDYTTWLVFTLKAFPKLPIGLFQTTYRRPRPGGRR